MVVAKGNINQGVIRDIREFNRFYTNVLGLLNQHLYDSPYSLTELRILLEIDRTEACTANTLIEMLDVDRGYMSRILKGFEKDGLIIREASTADGRVNDLKLTAAGKETLAALEAKSDNQVWQLIQHLSKHEQEQLIRAMKCIRKAMSTVLDEIHIRTFDTVHTGDIEAVIRMHRDLYEGEYGFNGVFGDYVAETVQRFYESHDQDMENLWIAEFEGKITGQIAVVKVDRQTAQLRWFLIDPNIRGKGLGRRLLETALQFCRDKGYRHIFLWTASILGPARHLYESYGFTLTESIENNTWSENLIQEERWELKPE